MEQLRLQATLSEAKVAVVNPIYENVLLRLVKSARNGIIEFNGGPLDLESEKPAWLSPVEVQSDNGSQFFHLIYLNSTPDTFSRETGADVVFFEETEIKLADKHSFVLDYYQDATQGPEPRLIIRPVQLGIAYFHSLISTGDLHLEYFQDSIARLTSELGVTVSNTYDLRRHRETTTERAYGQGVTVTSEASYDTPFGEVTVANIVVDDDDWRHYQLITRVPVDASTSKSAHLRIDSGCDSGQLYLDRGCDCREQLHAALEDVVQNDGIVVHVPTHDGRGYGTAVKMETEGMKRGVPMVFNKTNPTPLDTIQAAQVLFGEDFDLRTYDGVGRVLRAFGFEKVMLQTNNKIKIRGLEEVGLTVSRVPAITVEKHPEARHAESKKRYGQMYFKE
ncbi:hypothetical protein A2781_03545 [Candidatus Gottesmanbacteria bacterium RIFCSPHIGHO2_01_FULL_42_27]|uniref:3,4-dihydroxy-2-butanone 4-phosphate synthase n=1 Tax=Candidatus Gottesmanbacteria bacterium GW2011_GWA2_42_18 TaxID=1618442 RepID=A0A0G1BK83_9BACT|nr:MAG: 3,4-dihydroxy-2-butanone 4-phosphate synthase [Candidatus Gottesmanbacteria bacterium GW2011_GWA2_42_18]KKS73993.1 MAG: 3,4-dihydroxy-2-butanone 4-phosphate synthase [Candidatus Gottesmanbacteria bacterium GW2011_GWC2_42_8]OGG12113.1 MAG: hypothetical protein A2781_03545 [Candidatus Gottesmanbacteria bacterium RIFCSPHIGHO2_01_FULL_42_27]OGG22034.1 MAG: hypothetical protein A3E72_00890 [Candidatus Gottesmanbacteria bacterium RIFCSPHIGHO2_12_FULL_43_26]OGG35637.1 MAG: hypothetical protein